MNLERNGENEIETSCTKGLKQGVENV